MYAKPQRDANQNNKKPTNPANTLDKNSINCKQMLQETKQTENNKKNTNNIKPIQNNSQRGTKKNNAKTNATKTIDNISSTNIDCKKRNTPNTNQIAKRKKQLSGITMQKQTKTMRN